MKKSLNLQDKILKKLPNIDYINNYDTKTLSTMRIGTIVDLFYLPKNYYELQKLVKLLIKYKTKYIVIGNLSNTVITSNKVLISLKNIKKKLDIKDKTITLSGNYRSSEISYLFSKRNISTFLSLTKIPGTISGAIVMNSSVSNYKISDNIQSVLCLNDKGKIKKIKRNNIKFSYRNSSFKDKNYIILEASFIKINDNNSSKKYYEIINKRSNQPKGFSLGSIYKNGMFYYAGKLIENTGLKGFSYKGFKISNIHSNIIINESGVYTDFIDLLFIIELSVLLKYNIRLVKEIIIY